MNNIYLDSQDTPPNDKDLLALVNELRLGLMAKATDGSIDVDEYTNTRNILINRTDLESLIPDYLKFCRAPSDFRRLMQTKGGYAERRDHINRTLEPLLQELEERAKNIPSTHLTENYYISNAEVVPPALNSHINALERKPIKDKNHMIRIFVSHSSKDEGLVGPLVQLLTSALEVRDEEIRCTTLPGYKLSAGTHTSTQLSKEIRGCNILIGVVTQNSLSSHAVLAELGAGWGLNKKVIGILGPGAGFSELPWPLNETHAIKWQERHDWETLIDDLAKDLSVQRKATARWSLIITQLTQYREPR